jgi:hypothetical protein
MLTQVPVTHRSETSNPTYTSSSTAARGCYEIHKLASPPYQVGKRSLRLLTLTWRRYNFTSVVPGDLTSGILPKNTSQGKYTVLALIRLSRAKALLAHYRITKCNPNILPGEQRGNLLGRFQCNWTSMLKSKQKEYISKGTK